MKEIIFCYFLFIVLGCNVNQNHTGSLQTTSLNDGILTAAPSTAGLNLDSLDQLTNHISSGFYPNIHSLLIYKNDRLLYEKYFPGKDEKWGDDLGIIEHKVNDLHDIRSISKSVVSACVGLAITQQKIKDVNQRVFHFFPEYAAYDTGMKKDLSIKHLLNMTSGLEWNEEVPYDNPQNSEIQMTRSNDPIEFVLSRRSIRLPGKEWKYNGGTPNYLQLLLKRSQAKRLTSLRKNIFSNRSESNISNGLNTREVITRQPLPACD